MIAVTVQPNLPPARIPYGDVRLGVLVARREFPTNPCIGHEQVQVSNRAPRWVRDAFGGRDILVLGAADLAGQRCLIWVSGALDRATTCKVTAHELNHWNGAEDNDGTSLMESDTGALVQDEAAPSATAPDWPYAPCEVPR